MGRADDDQDGREQAAGDGNDPAPEAAEARGAAHRDIHSHLEQTVHATLVIPAVSRLSDVQFSRLTETLSGVAGSIIAEPGTILVARAA